VALGSVAAGVAFFLGMGFRPDIGHALETVRFLFKFVVTLSLAVAATGLIPRMGQPGAPSRFWAHALAVAPVLLGLAVLSS
jgi:hypothetical protein